MDFQEFVSIVNKFGYGVIFNTYYTHGVHCGYLMVSQKGDFGTFFKSEFQASDLNENLEIILNEIKNYEYKKR